MCDKISLYYLKIVSFKKVCFIALKCVLYFLSFQYNLTLVASDTLFENFTTVFIKVKDINDLPPKFSQSLYQTHILEEDSDGLPKRILTVSSILTFSINFKKATCLIFFSCFKIYLCVL